MLPGMLAIPMIQNALIVVALMLTAVTLVGIYYGQRKRR